MRFRVDYDLYISGQVGRCQYDVEASSKEEASKLGRERFSKSFRGLNMQMVAEHETVTELKEPARERCIMGLEEWPHCQNSKGCPNWNDCPFGDGDANAVLPGLVTLRAGELGWELWCRPLFSKEIC